MFLRRVVNVIFLFVIISLVSSCSKTNETKTADNYLNTDLLTDSNLQPLVTEIYGENTNPFIIFIFSPNCSACKNLINSTEYNAFLLNPVIKMYKINIVDVPRELEETLDIQYIPMMLLVEEFSDNKYKIDRYIGSADCVELLENYII